MEQLSRSLHGSSASAVETSEALYGGKASAIARKVPFASAECPMMCEVPVLKTVVPEAQYHS